MKLLIIEDNQGHVESLRRLISCDTFNNIVVCSEEIKGIECAGLDRPDLCLVDIHMYNRIADWRGIEAAKQIYWRYNIPVVFKTIDDRQQTFARAGMEGVFGYVNFYPSFGAAYAQSPEAKQIQFQLKVAHHCFLVSERNSRYIRVAIDRSQLLTAANYRAREDAFHISDLSRLLGSDIRSYLTESSRAELAKALINIDNGSKVQALQLEIKRANESVCIFSCRIWPIVYEKLTCPIAGYNILGWDVTEIATLQDKLRIAAEMQAIALMTAGVVHDLNNPIAAIKWYAFQLRNLVIDQEATRMFEGIEEAVIRLEAMRDQMLRFSRGKAETKVIVNVSHALSKATQVDFSGVHNRAIAVSTRKASTELVVLANEMELRAAFLNLIKNAQEAILDSNNKDSGRIEITMDTCIIANPATEKPDLKPGRYVRVVVQDNGKGMTPCSLKGLFTPFFSTKGSGGTGLGLMRVKGTVERYGGFIEVGSELGLGATFTIYLPLIENIVPVV